MDNAAKTKEQLLEELAAVHRRLAELESQQAEHRGTEQVQTALYRIADAAIAVEDMQEFYATMHQIVGELMVVKNFFIALWDEATGLLSFPYYADEFDPPPPPREADRGLTEYLIRTGKPLHLDPDEYTQLIRQGEIELIGSLPLDWLGIPLLTDEGVIGTLVVQSYTEGVTYTDQDVALLNYIGQHIATALGRARLLDETRQRVAELATINSISQAISTQLELDTLIALVGEQMRQTFNADIVYVALYDRETNMIHFPYEYGDKNPARPFGQGLTERIIATRQPLLINKEVTERSAEMEVRVLGKEPLSYLGVPITVGQQTIGVISVQSTNQEGRFDDADLNLLNTIAANVGAALQNARLFQESQQAKKAAVQANRQLSQALDNLKATQSQLVEAEKMAALGGLVAGVAHEINTPVGVGVTAASLLEDKTAAFRTLFQTGQMKRSDLEKYLDTASQSSGMILKNLQRAAELIHSFKQVAVDQSSEERRLFAVKPYLEEVLLSLHPRLKRTRLTTEIRTDDGLTLDSYPGAFAQIVTNLVMNSLIHAYEPGQPGQLLFELKQKNERFVFEYADDGRGILPEHLSKIFDPFFTTKGGQGGSGLGLHIIYNLVTQKLGGTIRCESEVDVGTRFMIELPMTLRNEK